MAARNMSHTSTPVPLDHFSGSSCFSTSGRIIRRIFPTELGTACGPIYPLRRADGIPAGRLAAISHPRARRRAKSLWERDFCVKCDEAHFGARVLGPLGTRVPDSRASPDHFWDGGKRRTLGFPQEDQSIGTGWRRRRPGARHRRSTGIGAAGEQAVGKLPRHVAKTWWNAATMAADLTVVEDHRQRVGKDTDHGQHDEGTVLM